jgi:hypothetical protein
MNTVVGIFSQRKIAESALEDLRRAGFRSEELIYLTPQTTDERLARVPSEDGEQPGMGKAIGGVAGGAVGLAGGALAANFLLPGVGPILALGLAGAAFGIGGAVAGAATGDLLENLLTRGLPKDEIFFYEAALEQGRSLILVLAQDEPGADRARAIMERDGAESLDAARSAWWIGLRDSEATEHDISTHSSSEAEQSYRRGFEAALQPQCRGKTWGEAKGLLTERHGHVRDQEAFRRGYERGQKYCQTHRHPSLTQ